MATLPDVSAIRPAPRPSRAIAQISPGAAGAVGGAVEQLGAKANLLGMQILDREATAAAKDADAAAADKIRSLLYDPETGFANLQGGDAVAARERVIAQIDQIASASMEGLGKEAQRKLKDSLDARKERALATIDGHTADQRRTWIEGGRDARIQSAYQDVLADPGVTDTELLRIEGELRGRAADQGWDAAKTEFEVTKARSTVYRGVAEKIAAVDPEGAAAYLQQNRNNMLGSDVTDLEMKLIPLAKAAEGRRIGAAVAGGLPVYSYDTKIDYAMGPARPNKPEQPILDVIGKSAEDVFGKGARIVVTSGQENEGEQHGSNRHGTGLAADISIYRSDGSLVKATDADMAMFARAAAKNGALGIGFGAEYMGGDHIHVDLVTPGAGQANTWSSGANAIKDQLVAEMAGRKAAGNMSMAEVLDIPDPAVRAAAIDELNLRSSAREGERKATLAAASNAAFGYIEHGGSLNDLTYDETVAIGMEGMTSLRAYERSVRAGFPIATDPVAYANLTTLQLTDPVAFGREAASGFANYANSLSPADRKSFVDKAAKPPTAIERASAATLMGIAEDRLKSVIAKPTPVQSATMQTQLLQWQESFIAQNGKNPSQLEIDQQVGRLLTPLVINPPGMGNEFDGTAMEASALVIDEAGLVQSDMTIGGVTVPPSVMQEQVDLIKAAGGVPTAAAVTERLMALMGGN